MTLKNIYLYFCYPALVIHELTHLVACIITFTMPSRVKIGLCDGYVKYVTPKYLLTKVIINLAPLFFYILISIISFFNPYFLILFIYLTITYKISFPSETDYKNVFM